MVTQNVTLDGTSDFEAFGWNHFWGGAYIEVAYFENSGSATVDTLNLSLTGPAWRIRRLAFDSESDAARMNLVISDANDGIQRRIDWLQLQDYGNTTITLYNSRVRFIDGGVGGAVTLNLGAGNLNRADLWDVDSVTVRLGSGSADFLGLGGATATVIGGSGWIGVIEADDGTAFTFNGGTGSFGTIRAWGVTNSMTFQNGGDAIVMGDGLNTLSLNGGFFGAITSYSGTNTLTVGTNAEVRSVGFSGGKDVITVSGRVEQIQTGSNDDRVTVKAGGEIESVNLGGGNNAFSSSGNHVWVVNAYGENDTFQFLAGQTDQAYAGGGNNLIRLLNGYYVGSLRANEGNDTLIAVGDSFIDQAQLGDGTNSASLSNSSIGSLRVGSGNDTVTLAGSYIDFLDLGGGVNNLVINTGSEIALVRGNGNETITLTGDAKIQALRLEGGVKVFTSDTRFTETYYAHEARNALSIGSGGIGEILITGSAAAQQIVASGWLGSLQVYAGNLASVQATTVTLGAGGAGYIQTSKGKDLITTGTGHVDSINTYDSADRVTVGAGGVTSITTGIGNDTVNAAGGFVETISTGDGNDSVTTGASGAGYVSLGTGNDTVVLSAFTAADTMIVVGGDGTDTANMTGFGAALRVSLAQPGLIQNVGAATGVTTPALGFVGLSGIENLIGSNSGDWIEGGADANVLTGLGGNDTISGLDGNDSLLGGRGNDSLTGGAGVDRFVFVTGDGTDRVADFTVGQDRVELREANALADLTFTQVGTDVRLVFGTWTGIFEDMLVADLRVASNFLF